MSPTQCTHCQQDLDHHCSTDNPTCDWMVCLTKTCSAYIYDFGRGILRYRDGHTETWAEQD